MGLATLERAVVACEDGTLDLAGTGSPRAPAHRIHAVKAAIWGLGAAAVLLSPYLLVLLLDSAPVDGSAARAGHLSILLTDIALASAGMLLLCDWWISHSTETGVLGASLAFIAVQELPFALAWFDPTFADYSFSLSLTHLIVVGAWAAVIATIGRRPVAPPRHPFAVGAGLSAIVLVVRLVMVDQGRDPVLDPGPRLLVAAAVGALVVAACLLAVRNDPTTGWVWLWIAGWAALWFAARLLATATGATTPPVGSVVLMILASTLVVTAAGSLVRSRVSACRRELLSYGQRAHAAEADLMRGRELVHEMNDAVAGIAAGANLLAHGGVSDRDRAMLLDMVDAEMSRLGRMTSRTRQSSVAELTDDRVVLDEVFATLATAQEALGRRVDWQPRGHVVRGDRDAVAEVLTVLLTNAAHHAAGLGTEICTEAVGHNIEIRVSDHGPGIPQRVIPTLFEWGARGPSSTGTGIGLQVARRLVKEQSGTLELEVGHRRAGATFVIRLPAAPTSNDADSYANAPHAGGSDRADQREKEPA